MQRSRRGTDGGARGRARLAARALTTGAVAAAVLAAVACSSGSSSSGGSASSAPAAGSAAASSPAAGGGASGGQGAAGSAIEVGSIIDLTGVDATSGAAQQAGMGYFLQQLNAGGGINGRPLKVTYCDAASTPQGAAQCAQQFASLSSHLVITQTSDPPTRGALPYLTKDLVVDVDPILLPKSGTNVFQATAAGSVIAAALVSAVKKSGLHTIGVLYTTDTSGTHQLEAAQAAAKTAGITVVSQPQTAGVTDVTPQLLKLKSMGADVFYLASIGANTAAAVSSYKTLGLTTPVVAGAAAVTNAFLKSLSNGIPANLYGTSELIGDTTGLPAPIAQAWSQYRSAFTKYANQPVDTQTTSAIYVGCVAEAALKASSSFSVSDMAHALEAGTIPCLGVQQKFSIPGLNVVAGQPAAVTKAGASATDGWGPYQGNL
jgi:ABC-type branched-subunit amino acid transport system substrate-binding protein